MLNAVYLYYKKLIRSFLIDKLMINNIYQLPKINKIRISTFLRDIESPKDPRIDRCISFIAFISGQVPIVIENLSYGRTRESRVYYYVFKNTLRRERIYRFLELIILTCLPNFIKKQVKLSPKFSMTGTYSFQIPEYSTFSEIAEDFKYFKDYLTINIVFNKKPRLLNKLLMSALAFPLQLEYTYYDHKKRIKKILLPKKKFITLNKKEVLLRENMKHAVKKWFQEKAKEPGYAVLTTDANTFYNRNKSRELKKILKNLKKMEKEFNKIKEKELNEFKLEKINKKQNNIKII